MRLKTNDDLPKKELLKIGTCNRTFPVYNFSQQDNFLYNQRLRETASPCILGGRVNETDVLNTNNIFTPPSTLVNLEEDQPEQFFNWAVENGFFQENFALLKALKPQQH